MLYFFAPCIPVLILISSGKLETIAGVPCYVATPTIDYPKDKVVLFLPDVFGIELINAQVRSIPHHPTLLLKSRQLLADDFAQNGFKVRIWSIQRSLI